QSQLLREMWGPTHAQDAHYLRILVSKLRQKLGDDASAPQYIVTEPGVGLRFVGKERPLHRAAADPSSVD
ncbi:MAG: winged helix-turn-helix domain-containing protein, partial [Burkholderiales bacterium]|nr:winged helix-turn-helix domain-containing protein [Burkholderiales bacterium]